MKRHLLFGMGTLLAAALTLGGCSSEDDLTAYSNRIWNVTGTGQKDADPELTRGMSVGGDDGKTLYFNWDGDEQIVVLNAAGQSVGMLSVTVNPSNTALVNIDGQISGTYSVGDKVTYYVPAVAMDLTGQKGTMADLSKNFSYLTASVAVKEIDAEQKAITMGGASFTRRPAILRLRLTDSDGNRLNVEELKVAATSGKLVKSVAGDGTKTYYGSGEELTITPGQEDGAYPNEFFIALLNDSENKDTYSFTAKVGNSYYSSVADAQKISAKLVGGKYYTAVRKLTKTTDGDVETTGDFTFSTIDPQQYTGSQLMPAVTVYYQSNPLTADTDYELHYFDNVNVGRAFVVAVGKGDTYGEKAGVTTFTINSATITESMLTDIGTQTYSGSPLTPAVTLTGLTQGTDYTVSYADNTDVGTAKVTITATGNYSGELETTFDIQKATPTITLTTTEMKLKPDETETRTATTDFGTVTYESSNTAVATVDATGKVTAVADGTATITASVAGTDNWNAASVSYTVTVATSTEVAGDRFTINSSGTKVIFSQGNLQATYNGSSWTWKFAENQWDYIGNAEGNTKVSATSPYVSGYRGSSTTVDLFGWVGASSTWTDEAAIHGITSSTATDNTNGYGNEKTENLKSDWGNLTITNGGSYTWRTLTGGNDGEWKYILSTRSSGATVNGTQNARYTHATINTGGTSVNGLILFPDGCQIDNSSATSWGNINSTNTWDNSTKCTTDQWAHLAELGCVFLPAAGSRNGTTVNGAGSIGYYWSSSPNTSYVSSAYSVLFSSGSLDPAIYLSRYGGRSVRLVRVAQ